MNNLNVLAVLTGALLRCRSLAGNGHAARPAALHRIPPTHQ
jgi:hypothetical protein